MATTPPGTARALRASDGALELSEFFAPQRTSSDALPDPDPFLRNLTRGVIEVLAGVREVDQLARWLTEDPYRKLVTRSNLAARARSARGMAAKRPVHTILVPEYQHSQEGTIHFRYLLDGPNSPLRISRSLDEHAAGLARVLDGDERDPQMRARFVEHFVRPGGLEVRATDRFVDALERVAAQPAPQPLAVPAWAPAIRPLLSPFAHAAARRARRISRAFRDQKARRLAEHRRRKAADAVARAEHAVSRR